MKWKSVSTLFESFVRFIDWLKSTYDIEDWMGISEEIIHSYLLIIENQQNRDIEKGRLFNLFEFGRKKNLLVANAIRPFKAHSYEIIKDNFTLEDQALLN